MACSTRPAVRSYLNFIEEYLGETITQDEWHKIREIANPDGPSKGKAGDNWRIVTVHVFDGTPVDSPGVKTYKSSQDADSDQSYYTFLKENLLSDDSPVSDIQIRKMDDATYAAALLNYRTLWEHLNNGWEPNGDELSRRYDELVNSVKENPPTQGTVNAIEYLAFNGVKETLEEVRDQDLPQKLQKLSDESPSIRTAPRPLKIKNPHYDMTSTIVDDVEGGGYELEVENPRWKHSVIASPENDQYEREITIKGFSGSVRIGMQGELGVQESAAFIALAAEERLRWEGRNDLDDLQWTVPDGWGMD